MGPNPQVFFQDLTWLSQLSRSYSQIHCKVWRKNELLSDKCLFSKIFQILFIVNSTFIFFVIPECLYNSWWSFSSSFSAFEDRRRISLQSYPFSRRFMVLALCHPLIIVFDCENSPIRSNARVFLVWFCGAHHLQNYSFKLSALILQIIPVHHSSSL